MEMTWVKDSRVKSTTKEIVTKEKLTSRWTCSWSISNLELTKFWTNKVGGGKTLQETEEEKNDVGEI